jgi:hypothetical protein
MRQTCTQAEENLKIGFGLFDDWTETEVGLCRTIFERRFDAMLLHHDMASAKACRKVQKPSRSAETYPMETEKKEMDDLKGDAFCCH